jgi:fibronectin-binding autotransporter adhesin
VVNNDQTSNFGGVIQNSTGTLGLSKTGTGTQILSGTNTYRGIISVSEGTLQINGANTGLGLVTVDSGATLGGTGLIAGALNVTGVLSPGASIQSLASGVLTMNLGSTLVDEAANNSATGADLMVMWDFRTEPMGVQLQRYHRRSQL